MPYEIGYGMGRGVGRGRGRGHGSGFRGFSPPWPYVGRGRGGLPRCGYYADYSSYIAPNSPGEVPVAANYDLGGLKNSVNALKDRLAQMQAMISEMEQQKA